MVRALWFLLRVGFLIALVIWIAERPGVVTVEWLDYTMRIQVGFFLLILLSVVILGILIFSLIKGALDFPVVYGRYRRYSNRMKGLRAITLGLTAVAAGDSKTASYQAYRARNFLPADEALPKLLEAQAARLKGDEAKAVAVFTKLLGHKDASFLGLRGLLQTALDCGDDRGALELGRKALEKYPKQGWILKVVYDLEIRLQNWNTAALTLLRAERAGTIPKDKAQSDRVAIMMAQAQDIQKAGDENAYRKQLLKVLQTQNHFVPAVVALGRLYLAIGKRRAAVGLIERAWKSQPHPDLISLWSDLKPQGGADMGSRVRWFERLLSLKPDSVEGLLALARVLMQEGLWGEARKNLEMAEKIRPNVNLYKLWAELEDRATRDQIAVRKWLEKAADAPRERVWICRETGRIYDSWSPVSDQGLFNTIIWDFPIGRSGTSSLLPRAAQAPIAFLESISA